MKKSLDSNSEFYGVPTRCLLVSSLHILIPINPFSKNCEVDGIPLSMPFSFRHGNKGTKR